jgi:hypothetical protein
LFHSLVVRKIGYKVKRKAAAELETFVESIPFANLFQSHVIFSCFNLHVRSSIVELTISYSQYSRAS